MNTNPKHPRPGTQKAIVLKALLATNGKPVAVNHLMIAARSAAVHSVVSDLRLKYGWNIKNRQRTVKDFTGKPVRHSEYWIPLEPINETKPPVKLSEVAKKRQTEREQAKAERSKA